MLTVKTLPYACRGCGMCVETCMLDVLRMVKGKATVVYPEDCQACFLCVEDCPRQAIKVVKQSEA